MKRLREPRFPRRTGKQKGRWGAHQEYLLVRNILRGPRPTSKVIGWGGFPYIEGHVWTRAAFLEGVATSATTASWKAGGRAARRQYSGKGGCSLLTKPRASSAKRASGGATWGLVWRVWGSAVPQAVDPSLTETFLRECNLCTCCRPARLSLYVPAQGNSQGSGVLLGDQLQRDE